MKLSDVTPSPSGLYIKVANREIADPFLYIKVANREIGDPLYGAVILALFLVQNDPNPFTRGEVCVPHESDLANLLSEFHAISYLPISHSTHIGGR